MEPQLKKLDSIPAENAAILRNLFHQDMQFNLDDLLARITAPAGKKSFLVFKHNKYFTVGVEKIAFFYVKYESSIIACFDRQEYFVSRSLEQIQNLVTSKQFFRLNRQYLISFNAVKEVEHYFARKLLVNLTVPAPEKLIVPKEKATCFLHWLEDR
ncbi:MAG: LytTR family DNA-binding domain-containing protein [Ginsengibacter sp.]